jgi:hypothetical protein
MRLLKEVELVLERRQPGGRLATEKMAKPGDHSVLIDQSLLKEHSDLVAFILAANLSEKPATSTEIGKLTKAAVERGAVTIATGARGAILLGREGTEIGVVKNHAADSGMDQVGGIKNDQVASDGGIKIHQVENDGRRPGRK